MKNLFQLYARFNQDMDIVVLDILQKMPEAELHRERNMYYKNLPKLVLHMIRGVYGYQKGIQLVSNQKYLKELPDHDLLMEEAGKSFTTSAEVLKRLDTGFLGFIDSLEVEDLNLVMKKFTMYNGRIVAVSIGEIITQHMTHQIHHRGQLSQVLDEMNIEHDIGNIWPYVKDSQ